jgi:MOSC domain-containing protein YiiM
MEIRDQVDVSIEKGIAGDFRGGLKNRQITVMSFADWQSTCAEISTDLPWTIRRANLLVEDLVFKATDIGRMLCIGDTELEVTQETDPCSRMDEQHEGLKAALMPDWRGGVCCKVIKAGSIKVGDRVELK